MKKLFLLFCTVIFIITSFTSVLAEDFLSSNINTINDNQISELNVSVDKIEILQKGASEFVDANIILKDGSFTNVNNSAIWISDNPEIVFPYEGRILALNEGSTTVTVYYNDFKQKIDIKVLKEKVFEKVPELSILPGTKSSDPSTIKAKCSAMINYGWKPTKNLIGWRDQYTFKANNTYNGIPYSQTEYQKDDTGFGNALKLSDFYDAYSRVIDGQSIKMPKYGNDCSGFTSFAWGISRHTSASFISGIKNEEFSKVGEYDVDNPTKEDLKTAYESLTTGDAVVTNGHVFVIDQNNSNYTPKSCYCYEQTPYLAIWSIWTYDQMANGKYRPFRQ
jgi:hypothetical protein